jgi:CrcB protein
MLNRTLLLIGTGGLLGSMARYLLTQFIQNKYFSTLPLGTLIVNISGCFLIGIFFGLAEKGNINPDWRSFLTTGFCGGFTTFSTFTLEGNKLMQGGEFFYLSLYVGLSVVVGFAATYAGILLTKTVLS